MNSPALLDLAALPAATSPVLPSLPNEDSEPFGAILEEATDDLDEVPDGEVPAESTEKKKHDITDVIPLYYFCPPPAIDVATPISIGPSPQIEISIPETEPESPANAAAPEQSTSAEPLTQTVAPKLTQATPPNSPGAVELKPKLFEPVLVEAAPSPSQSSRAPDPQRTPVTNASHGTLVAQLENSVKNSEKTAEIAPLSQQKMPVRDVFRRAVAEVSRVESFHADKPADHVLDASFASESREPIPVKSIQAVHLVESIRTEVATLRQRNDTTISVVLRPDSGTQLSLDISISRDGSVHAQARCERGDFQTLQAQWPQLQQSLAAHGIRIADLASNNNPQQQNHSSAGGFQNFDRGQNPQQQSSRDLPSFENQFAAKTKIPLANPQSQPQPATHVTATRRWQSWA
jgi:hypothetical protein